jgi:ADP-ribosylation factor-like protein 8
LLPDAKMELHRLLEDKELAKTAVLIVANKIDLEPHASEPLLIRGNNTDAAFFLMLLL